MKKGVKKRRGKTKIKIQELMLPCLLCWTFKFEKKFHRIVKQNKVKIKIKKNKIIFFHISFLNDPQANLLCHSSVKIFQYSIQLFVKIIFVLTYFGSFSGSPCSQPSITLKFRSFFHLHTKTQKRQIWDLMKIFLIFHLHSQFFTSVYLELSK